MPSLSTILHYLPMVIAPFALFIFSLVSAYVLKFGLRRTGISADYVVFGLFVTLAVVLGGAV